MARPAAVVPVSSFQRTRPDTDFPVHGTYRSRLAGSSAHSEPLPRLTYRTESQRVYSAVGSAVKHN
ncbi:hypothetical protein J6590_033661 [Homalodisca vitripennis]|nr:hypothetical protein J6590_033661 [Homalodisca vitripennis]